MIRQKSTFSYSTVKLQTAFCCGTETDQERNITLRTIRRFFFSIAGLLLLLSCTTDSIPAAYAASTMTASESCVEFIKAVEGFSSQPYYDYSQYTVGYGTKCPMEKYEEYMANGIPQEEAESMLRQELASIENALNTRLIDKNNLSLSQHQFDALVSFSFNIGTNWLTYNSTLRHALLNPTTENDMVYAFSLYCTAGGKYLPGLVNRRLCEANMFLNGTYSQTKPADFGYVYYDANGGTVTYRVQGYLCDSNSAPAENAVRGADTFLGWYTDLTGGTQVNTLTHGLSGKTLFARWQVSENTDSQISISATVKVTGDVVNVRNGPGTGYGIVRQARRNETLTISHVTHLTNMKWGKTADGWICLDYTNYDAVTGGTGNTDIGTDTTPSDEVVIPETDSLPNDAGTGPDISEEHLNRILGVVNVNDFLRIRSGPGTTYSTVGYLLKNDTVEIFDQKTSGSTLWGRIERGWVSMDYIVTGSLPSDETTEPEDVFEVDEAPAKEPENTVSQPEAVSIKGRITADALRIRSAAGTASSIVGFYYENDVVTVSEKVLVGSGYWGKTGKGWISMDYVAEDSSIGDTPIEEPSVEEPSIEEPSIEEPSEPSAEDTKTVIADCLRIRKDAGTNHKIVGFLYFGDKVTVLETKTAAGSLWGRVDSGWISMNYVN